jgi:TRAP-type transport system small permease protein
MLGTQPPRRVAMPTHGLVERLSRLIAGIGLAALVVLAIVSVLDIVGRELFKTPIEGFSDIADLLVVFAAAACFPVSLAEGHHVAVRFIGQLHWRLWETLELLGHVLLLAVLTLIVWQLTIFAVDVYRSSQTTWLMHIPVWPLWTITTLLLAACLPVQAVVVWEQLRRVLSPVPLASLHAEETEGSGLQGEGRLDGTD